MSGAAIAAIGLGAPRLAITTISLPTPTYGGGYSQTVATSGGVAPIAFSVSAGALPGGLSLNSATGAITGTDSGAGSYGFTIKAIDAVGQIATQPFSGFITFGPAPGSVLLSDSTSGSGKTFTLPAGNQYAHVDVVLTGIGGSGNGQAFKGPPLTVIDYGGSGGSTAVYASFAVTPGATTFTYGLPSAVGTAASCSASGLALSAPSGVNATAGAPAAAPAAASGGTANYAGHAGGLVDTWDGGGAADINGSYVDNTTDATAGALAGQGAAGSYGAPYAGGPATLLLIARA